MKNIFYWSPCLSNIGTINSTLNSAIGLKKYFKENYKVVIINVCGEWDKYRVYLKKNNIEIKDLGFNYFKFLPKELTISCSSLYSFLLRIKCVIKSLADRKS